MTSIEASIMQQERVPGIQPSAALDMIVTTHSQILQEIGGRYSQSQEVYSLSIPEWHDYTATILKELGADFELQTVTRRGLHVNQKAGYGNTLYAFGLMWSARQGIALANGRTMEDIDSELNSVMIGASSNLVTSVRGVAVAEAKNYEILERSRPIVLNDVRSSLENGEISLIDVFGWLVSCDENEPANQGLILLIQQEMAMQKSGGEPNNSILSSAIQAYKQLTAESFLEDFITICENTPELFYRESKLLNFVRSFAKITSPDEFLTRLASTRDSWPEGLEVSLDKFITTTKNALLAKLKKRLDMLQFMGLYPSLSDLQALWGNTLAVLPPEALDGPQSRNNQIKARVATKRKSSLRPVDQSESGKDGEEDEEEPPIKRQLYVLKLTPSNVYVFDTNPQAVERMISEHVAKYPGVGGLEAQIRAAVNYLQTTRIPKGVKKFDNNTLRIEGDNSHAQIPLQSFKPTPDNGLQGSRIFRKTRIEFVWLDNGQIGLRNIHLRDDKVSSRRKKA